MAPILDTKTPEAHESIEAKFARDEDVEMRDAVDPANDDEDADAEGESDIDAEGEPDEDMDADAEADADGEPDDSQMSAGARQERDLLELIEETAKYLCELEEE
jgi:chromatin structure-remodeling complex subunit RSC1/2